MARDDHSGPGRPVASTLPAGMPREHFEAMLELLPTAVVLLEPGTGLITFANHAADVLAGGRFPRGTVEERVRNRPTIGEDGRSLTVDELPSMRIARGESVRGAQLEWHLEHRVLELLVSGDTVTDLEGRAVGVVVFEDVGPVREAERARDASLALLDTIFESAPVGLALHGPDLRFVRVNRALATMHGLTVEDHIGRLVTELTPGLAEDVLAGVRRVMETGQPLMDVEVRGETPARPGVTRAFQYGWYPVRDAGGGDIVGVGSVVTEITERVALLESERAARERAERAERQTAFLAEVGEILASSMDYEENITRVVRVAVRAKAGWCVAHLVGRDGSIRRLALAHADPAREPLLREVEEQHPPTVDDAMGPGNVLRSGRPELIREIDDDTLRAAAEDDAHAGLLRRVGLRTRMVVPIVVRGHMMGTLTFARGEGDRPYTLEDLRIVMEVARRAAVGIAHAELYRERSHIAKTLQRSLLPPRLPDIPGFELAARYRAAGEGFDVGGDFYDVFETREGWALVVGDVCGKGPEAASLTSLARSALRTGAVVEDLPARVLQVTNEAILRERIDDRFLTAVYLHLDPDAGTLLLANGGHPPVLVVRAAGEVEAVDLRGPVIGVLPDTEFEDTGIALGPGDAVVAYTDGVLDAGAPERLLRTDALAELLARNAGRSASELAQALEQVAIEVSGGSPRDDIAVLVLRRPA